MNTSGMLLAHIAYAENHLTQVGLEGKPTSDTRAVIGISEAEEGLPLAAGAPPSAAPHGRSPSSRISTPVRAPTRAEWRPT
jgi:hypothetical protein